ncbi:MAG: helicase C-terminal domain-containing protein [Planctomycetota bacterium]
MNATSAEMLGAGGAIASLIGEGFEARAPQQRMAEAIDDAMQERAHLMVEAGTGVGKSFAYLLPAIRRIIEHGERVVVSTNTINLQEQLVEKDVPLLSALFAEQTPDGPRSAFRAELVKGRGNYLSVRRLEMASRKQDTLFPDAATRLSLHVIEDWAYETRDGTLSTLPKLERPGVWDRVRSDAGNCMGRRCPRYEVCFYQESRRRMQRADLLICNHALFFSDLALRARGVGFLPPYDHVILDEAHAAEEVASEHFGVSITSGGVRHLLSMLYSARTRKGFLAALKTDIEGASIAEQAVRLVVRAGEESDRMFDALRRLGGPTGGRVREPEAVENTLSPVLGELVLALKRLREHTTNMEDQYELSGYAERAAAFAQACESLIAQELDGCAYWVESSGSDDGFKRTTLSCAPIDVAPALREALFEQEHSVVLTSATLSTTRGDFAHAQRRLGCDDAQTMALGSPFEYATQVTLYVDDTMPSPSDAGYLGGLAERIERQIDETDGGAFCLFTSHRDMGRVADMLAPTLRSAGRPLVVQGRDGSRADVLKSFTRDERSVLFGTASFWQGVDVRGDGLRNVIITRLPFEPPDRPLTQARHEHMQANGEDPFSRDSLPRAVVRFKQGFGRLIRSASDSGRVVVLDPRVLTKSYGRRFLSALPAGVPLVRVSSGEVSTLGEADG